jgi:hypothetical protein
MHPSRPHLLSLLAGWLVLLAGCSSPTSPDAIMDRVDAKRDVYESWPIEIKDAVLSGQVLRGMTTDMVYVARGKPTEKIDRGNGDEVWVYHIKGGESGGGMLGGGGGMLPRGTTVSVGTGGGAGYPGGGYPSGYPSGYPGTYPGSGTGVYIPPIVLGGGGGGSYEPTIEDEIVFRNGRVTHGDGVK